MQIADKYNIPRQTFSDWIKKRAKIEEASQDPQVNKEKFRFKKPKEIKLEKRLNTYFGVLTKASLPVSGEMLRNKAREIALDLGIQDFGASNGWLHRFKDRFNIGQLSICGEANKVSQEQVDQWLLENADLINSYGPELTYNCDETGLFYNLLPNRTLAVRGTKCHGGEQSKLRLTVMLCCNRAGTNKLPPLIIGNFFILSNSNF